MSLSPVLLLLLLDLLVAASDVLPQPLCTSKACFTAHLERTTFQDAQDKCTYNGGSLTTVTDEEEAASVGSVVSRVAGRDAFWIGLRLQKGTCAAAGTALRGFEWTSGVEASPYSNWDREPASTCTEDRCVAVRHVAPGRDLKWTDASCRGVNFYLCKFPFAGMCGPLRLGGPGRISYTVPFSDVPFGHHSDFWPYGTFALATCGDQVARAICTKQNHTVAWAPPGPPCASSRERSCEYENGGCEHVCAEPGARCACRDGYELGEDEASCAPTDPCHAVPCSHECVAAPHGYACTCPRGLHLGPDRRHCVDVDECLLRPCGEHACHNTPGSYRCRCNQGFQAAEGRCQDVDECAGSPCPQGCVNSPGSFSCECFPGYSSKRDGRVCEDVDECLDGRCVGRCVNTPGGFRCSCPGNLQLADDGVSCVPEAGSVEAQATPTASVTRPATPTTSVTRPATPTTPVTRKSRAAGSGVTVFVLASVIPLSLLVCVSVAAVAAYRCSRGRSASRKKGATVDSYCWVSSGAGTWPDNVEVPK
uniref:Complement component C1q receptor n=1 Tax=Denticeps clupeoides TaxID=299321 RepID=A0AAY4C7V4_9TELE